jgi:squalene synthase HpnD
MIAVEEAYRSCEEITRAAALNFFYGMRLLPRPKRRAMYAAYAFARRVDDVGDGGLPNDEKLRWLEAERAALAWDVDLDDPIHVALRDVHGRFSLPLDALVSLIDGVEADARGTTYESFDELVLYCRHVAGSIGRLSLAIFGTDHWAAAAPLADDLGVAMQLTNILRDVKEDAGRGRVYLPSEDLARFGCPPNPLDAEADAWRELIRFQAARNRAWFERGLKLLPFLDPRSAACVGAMTGIYRRILDRIDREPDAVARGRISLPAWRKGWVAGVSLAAGAARTVSVATEAAQNGKGQPETLPSRVAPTSRASGRVAIVGGGLAGIAAALRCADNGLNVTLVEVRPQLGGAAYSFEREGMWLDNGQHVFLRCCTEYLALLDRLGSRSLTRMQPRLAIPVIAPGGRVVWLRRTSLRAPLHLATALAGYGHLSPKERLRAALAASALSRLDPEDPRLDAITFGEWLAQHDQSPGAVAALWDLIARPTLNLPAGEASLGLAARVFQMGLLTDAAAGDIGWAAAPLSDVHDAPARRELAQAGVDVRLRWRARRVAREGGEWAIEGEGDGLVADAVVLAVPHDRLASLLPPGALRHPERLGGLGRSPIVNLHVLLDRRVTDLELAAGLGSPIQWVFDRTRTAGLERGQYLAISLSAAEQEMALSPDELRALYLPALAELFPAARAAKVERFAVSREHSATFRSAPGVAALRPAARTELPGLVLAGAFTDTGWPATMEGAVRSGHAAAETALGAIRLQSPDVALAA